MSHLLVLTLLAALVAIAAIAVDFLVIEADCEVTEPQARVLRTSLRTAT
ncbi:hypothetical protein ACFXC8_56620 [Streptomyces sp. NPDC059441]|jgi:hypothetical protein